MKIGRLMPVPLIPSWFVGGRESDSAIIFMDT
jgi:hypothetical protein